MSDAANRAGPADPSDADQEGIASTKAAVAASSEVDGPSPHPEPAPESDDQPSAPETKAAVAAGGIGDGAPETSEESDAGSEAVNGSSTADPAAGDGIDDVGAADRTQEPAATEVLEEAEQPAAAVEATEAREGFTLARVLAGVGRTLIGTGLVLLLFVGYQLWGTNIQEGRSQSRLQSNFSSTLDKVGRIDPAILKQLQESTTTSVGQPATTAPPATIPRAVIDLVSPQPGEAMAVIHIPKIKVERRVVEGTEVDDLRKGPGHYPGTPLPGQTGNAAIAGHRTTYGAPFNRIDELAPGDEINIQTVQGTAVYQVDAPPFVVSPTQVEVLRDFGDNRLTLTSCHPKLSAAQRMVVTAKLVSAPFPALPASSQERVQADVASTTTIAEGVENTVDPTESSTTTAAPTSTSSTSATTASTAPAPTLASESPAPDLQQGLGGDRSALPSAFGWGLATAAAGFVAWLVSRRWDRRIGRRSRLRHLAVYAVVSPAFLVLLFLCFENVDRLLPAY